MHKFLLLFVSLFPSIAAASALTVDEIVERHVEARGGHAKIAALRSLIIRGEYREGTYVLPGAAMALMRPYYKLVGDPEKPLSDFAEGYDGSAWEYYADPGFVVRTVGEASAAGRHRARFDHPLIHYRDFGTSVSLLGEDRVGDRPAYRLLMTLQDGFREEALIDKETFLLLAERKAAPIHAFGESVKSESRYSDFRRVEGVLFSFLSTEVDIATGKVLNEFRTAEIVANRDIELERFSPPSWKHTPQQLWIEQLYAIRSDVNALRWSYDDFRRAHRDLDTRDAAQSAGFQMLKMGDVAGAIALLEANARDYPAEASALFGLGRAYHTGGELEKARSSLRRAVHLDPNHKRAAELLKRIEGAK